MALIGERSGFPVSERRLTQTPRVEQRLGPVQGVRSLHSWFCFAPALLWDPGLAETCFRSVWEAAGVTEGLASLDSVHYGAQRLRMCNPC